MMKRQLRMTNLNLTPHHSDEAVECTDLLNPQFKEGRVWRTWLWHWFRCLSIIYCEWLCPDLPELYCCTCMFIHVLTSPIVTPYFVHVTLSPCKGHSYVYKSPRPQVYIRSCFQSELHNSGQSVSECNGYPTTLRDHS